MGVAKSEDRCGRINWCVEVGVSMGKGRRGGVYG